LYLDQSWSNCFKLRSSRSTAVSENLV
jgi:hypothetical protein